MSEGRHTPGPWTYSLIRVQLSINDPWGGPVAYVHGENVRPAESEANARLIAAAPEMLASLQALTAGGQRTASENVRMFREALMVIAKATGSVA